MYINFCELIHVDKVFEFSEIWNNTKVSDFYIMARYKKKNKKAEGWECN